MKRFLLHLLADLIIVLLAFIIVSAIYQGPVDFVVDRYQTPFIIFLSLFLVISFWFNKYEHDKEMKFGAMFNLYAKALFYTAGISGLAMYLFQLTFYSRLIILGTMLGIGILEFIYISIYQAFRMAIIIPEQQDIEHERAIRQALINEKQSPAKPLVEVYYRHYHETILEESGPAVLRFLEAKLDLDSPYTQIVSTTTRFNLLNLYDNTYDVVVNLKRINDVQYVNKFLESVFVKLKPGGQFINCVETLCLRKKRILKKYPPLVNWVIYRADFFIHRFAPKFPVTMKLYYMFSSGKNRVISKAEIFGRLYSCGFELVNYEIIDDMMWYTVSRVTAPSFDYQPTYGPLIRLKRVGKDGKIIQVYKMRTMHPYSEYLQDYVFRLNQLQEGGKFKNDFRVTQWGRIMRKLWLDELPMLYNLINGDLKLIGVRPLSKQYFSLYTPELQEKRKTVKPGLIPPYYAQFPTPKSLDEVMENENKYLDEYFKKPLTTDFVYFWKALYNIVVRNSRSS
jgi:lipopolysaccharide/colanic/teichoic acid biosynthesis glycosyltransferase